MARKTITGRKEALTMGYHTPELPLEPPEEEERIPHCPVCGAECEFIYRDCAFGIIGCDVCIEKMEAWDVDDCFPEQEDEWQ